MGQTNRHLESSIPRSFPVVLLLFLMSCSQVGTVKSIGIYLEDISLSLGTTSTDIGIALGLFSAFSFFPAPLIVALYRLRSLRRAILIVGSCMISLGVILTAFATNNALITFYLSISGFGHCMVGTSSPVALDHLADEDNFNILYGVGASGFGFGMVLLPLLAHVLGNIYGWRGGLLILGSLMANLVPCAMAIQPSLSNAQTMDHRGKDHELQHSGPSEERFSSSEQEETTPLSLERNLNTNSILHGDRLVHNDPSENDSTFDQIRRKSVTNDSNSRSVLERLRDSFYRSDFYRDPAFNCMFVAELVFGVVYCGWHAFLVPHAIQRGYSIRATILMTFFASAGNFLGRLFAGVLSDRLANPIILYLSAAILNVLFILCDAFLLNYYVMLVTACLSAIAIAGISVFSLLGLRRRASPGNFDVAFAVNDNFFGLGTFLGGYLSGFVGGLMSSYDATFKFVAGVSLLVFLLMLPVALIKKPRDI